MEIRLGSLLVLVTLLTACSQSAVAHAETVAPALAYPDTLATLDGTRRTLAAEYKQARSVPARTAVLGSAREAVFASITSSILPAWYGTDWDFYGTTEVPGEGSIACGYLVTTVLRDAGFHVERIRLAQQASEKIVKTLAAPSRIRRFRDVERSEVVRQVRASLGDGLYVVGLDYHVAFLVLDGERADLCHSAVLAPAHVVCEPASTSAGFVSRYYVVGPALDDARLTDWLEGRAIPTWQK